MAHFDVTFVTVVYLLTYIGASSIRHQQFLPASKSTDLPASGAALSVSYRQLKRIVFVRAVYTGDRYALPLNTGRKHGP